MALQPRIIACGNSVAAFAMAVRFLTGPAVMAAASIAVGLRGVLLRIAIVQVPSSPLPFHLHRSLPSDPTVASLFFFLLLRWRWPGLRAGVTPARHRPFRVCQGVQFACRYPQHSGDIWDADCSANHAGVLHLTGPLICREVFGVPSNERNQVKPLPSSHDKKLRKERREDEVEVSAGTTTVVQNKR
ncbi:hypothetical protein B296_00052000 [Ensete ventricosum]|uniref:Uncharacterized protein n=1 Tax=Ensete ventricosum TaxID=4639 RepID=A0A426XEH9_ENSVE|nr:hypothetical protein B296_00052000 [Ensete ventricosum]